MDKITTLNTLKNVFSALGAKTTDNNYAVGLFDKTSGEPKGMMKMSDLASVLGVISVQGIAEGSDLDSLIEHDRILVYICGSGTTIRTFSNMPGELSLCQEMVLISIYEAPNCFLQVVFERGNNKMYYRFKAGAWQSWQTVAIA